MRIIDIAIPAKPELLLTINKDEKGNPIDDAESVAMATVPFRTFAMLSDGTHGLHAINVTDFRDIRERLFNSSAFAPTSTDPGVEKAFQNHFNLTLALRDPLTPFDRANLQINAAGQVGNPPFKIITFPVGANQRLLRIARGRQLDKLADSSGRTLRDSTSVGAGALSREVMDKMRNVNVVVEPGTIDDKGNGLGNIVLQGSAQAAQGVAENRSSDRLTSSGNGLFTFGGLFAVALVALTIGVRRNRRLETRKGR
jgi:hypothetical protein